MPSTCLKTTHANAQRDQKSFPLHPYEELFICSFLSFVLTQQDRDEKTMTGAEDCRVLRELLGDAEAAEVAKMLRLSSNGVKLSFCGALQPPFQKSWTSSVRWLLRHKFTPLHTGVTFPTTSSLSPRATRWLLPPAPVSYVRAI
jgi:hypothetical protein